MRNFVFAAAIFAVVFANVSAQEVCDRTVRDETCKNGLEKKEILDSEKCTATFGAFNQPKIADFTSSIQELIQGHLELSMKYLELANLFNEWNVNRKGFHAYFSKLSDEAWEDAVNLMQHMIKRGGALNGSFAFANKDFKAVDLQNMCELTSLSLALDLEKKSVQNSLELLKTKEGSFHSDPEFTHFLAEKLSERHVLKVKHLANHVNALSAALDSTPNTGLALHIYDTQILK